ncbi:MAG: hypothetical protein WCJ21_01145 [Planctomycetota bacterium]
MVMRGLLRRILRWSVVGSVLLPVVLSIVVGLGWLLRSLGDPAGASFSGRLALALGASWLLAVIVAAVAGAVMTLIGGERGRRWRRFRRRPCREGRRGGKRRRRIDGPPPA